MNLLFHEMPVAKILLPIILLCHSYYIVIVLLILLSFLLYFFRYEPHTNRYNDNILVSPANGKITHLEQKNGNYYMSIFLSPLDRHTQIYPINGIVFSRIYDLTGKFGLANYKDKSRFNEKKIHEIMTPHGIVNITQIAGFLPRKITSSDDLGAVCAGAYLGMIKFGSRVDLKFPDNIIFLKKQGILQIGDVIGYY